MSVTLSRHGGVATISLERPEARNALTEAMGDAMAAHVAAVHADRSIRAVIVRGEGASFCAGGDLSFIHARVNRPVEENVRTMRAFYERFLSLRTLPVPTIALVHGVVMGAGVCVAIACDVRLCADDARLGLNFVRLGLSPGMGATALVPALVGPGAAATLLASGHTIDASHARAIGLVSELHPRSDLDNAGRRAAQQFAEASPSAVAATLRLLRARVVNLEDALDAEARAQAALYNAPDVAEGLAAARARRAPVFSERT